ncbi:MAG TPA: PIN domain-containing protein [Solirubrobacterales bacterium]|nr:PIN domain-containing protein [Solirubrobacterales bacterium]
MEKRLTLLDANALIAVIRGEPAMEAVLAILGRGSVAMTTANVAEVYDRSVRRTGLALERVAEVVEPLFEGPIMSIAVDLDLARRAGAIRSQRYHRKHRSLALADCILLAAAGSNDRIASSDSDLLAAAVELDIETIQLPPSSG